MVLDRTPKITTIVLLCLLASLTLPFLRASQPAKMSKKPTVNASVKQITIDWPTHGICYRDNDSTISVTVMCLAASGKPAVHALVKLSITSPGVVSPISFLTNSQGAALAKVSSSDISIDSADVKLTARSGTVSSDPFTINLTGVHVVFSQNPVRVGVLSPQTLDALVVPAPDVARLSVHAAGAAEAAVTVGTADLSTGDLPIIVTAKNPVDGIAMGTPASSPGGDEFLSASLAGGSPIEAPIIVVIPASIAAPHPQFPPAAITLQNVVATPLSCPAYIPPPGDVGLFTDATTLLTIQVNDQFGKPLDGLYTGAAVLYNGLSLNSPLTEAGTYTDPVGFAGLLENAKIGSPEIDPWPTFPGHAPVGSNSQTQNYQVRVAKVIVSPGVLNRKVAYDSFTRILSVSWPE